MQTFSWWQYLVAWASCTVIVIWVFVAVGDMIEGLVARFHSPKTNVNMQVNQMFTDDESRAYDPTIPVGTFNPKHPPVEHRRR
jgi:hypothetical protein